MVCRVVEGQRRVVLQKSAGKGSAAGKWKGSYRARTGQDVQLCHFSEGRQALWAGQALIRATSGLQMLFLPGILQGGEGMIVGVEEEWILESRHTWDTFHAFPWGH